MTETQFETVDIRGEVTVSGRTYTPQDRIVSKSVADELVRQKMAVILKPSQTDRQVEAAMEKNAIAHEKALANK